MLHLKEGECQEMTSMLTNAVHLLWFLPEDDPITAYAGRYIARLHPKLLANKWYHPWVADLHSLIRIAYNIDKVELEAELPPGIAEEI